MFENIELWSYPAEQLYSKMNFVCEMSEHDHAFLCGMIRHKNPKKLLEIGVAEGGTTAVIIKCLSLLGNKREVYSVDLNKRLYNDERKKTGYEYDRLASYIDRKDIVHRILLGGTIAEQIEQIGNEIDFVIIDTTHQLPGEILDFLCVFPYLAKEAVVVLHDVNLNYVRAMSGRRSHVMGSSKSVATKLLFSTVTANKYLPMRKNQLPNIAAFTISEDTNKYITDLFYLLTYTWAYIPEKNMLDNYRKIYEKYYDKFCLQLYDIAIINNQKVIERIKLAEYIPEEELGKYHFPYSRIPVGSKVVLYGAGKVGKEIYKVQKSVGRYKIVMWTDKRYKECITEGLEVDNPSNIQGADFDYIVVAVEGENIFQSIQRDILTAGWNAGKPIIGPVSQF